MAQDVKNTVNYDCILTLPPTPLPQVPIELGPGPAVPSADPSPDSLAAPAPTPQQGPLRLVHALQVAKLY